MTLKEKIRPHSQYWDCYNDEPLEYDHTNKLVKIAEEFAIGFAEWITRAELPLKELLEIYKKEKGL
jgi:hypothetical protein